MQQNQQQEWRDVKTGDNFPLVLPLTDKSGERFLFGTETDGQGNFRVKNEAEFKRLWDQGAR